MGTKSTSTQQNAYNPAGNAAYNQMMPGLGQQTTQFMNNPYSNPQFQLESQMGTSQANQLGQRGMNNLFQNQQASGFGGGPQSPFMQEMQANQSRANSGQQAQLGFMNPTMMANQRQQAAMQLASGFKPLQTGGTNTQTTGGLGTWLPQVAGAALGGLTGMATGGMSSLFGAGGGAAGANMGGGFGSGGGPMGAGFNPSAMGWGQNNSGGWGGMAGTGLQSPMPPPAMP